MRNNWSKPIMEVQVFNPNEYVSACFGVSCDWELSNKLEKTKYHQDTSIICHQANHCGNVTNQVIKELPNGGFSFTMIEEGTDGLGKLPCTVTGDIVDNDHNGIPDVGSTITWTTSAGNRTWHHTGVVSYDFPGRPLHS